MFIFICNDTKTKTPNSTQTEIKLGLENAKTDTLRQWLAL